MAVITSAASGNFSAPATWVGGVVPGVSDDAVAATTHVVTIDTNVTVISVQQAGTGKFILGNGRTLTGNVIANAGTFTSGGTVEVTATTGNTATINGNVTGVSTTANNTAGVVMTGTGALVINGSVTGSPGNNSSPANGSSAVYTNVTCTITINGAVTHGGTHKRGFQAGALSNGTFTIVGNITQAAGDGGCAYLEGASPTLSVTGSVTLNNGSSIAISANGASANVTVTGNLFGPTGTFGTIIQANGITSVVTITGNITNGSGTNCIGVSSTGAFATFSLTGSVTAGFAANAHGISYTGASSTVSVVGSATAAGTLSHAINSTATANGVIFQGNMTDSPQGAVAVYTRIFRMSATNSGVTRYANTVGYPNGTLVSRVSPDNVTGMAQVADVRKPVVYGYNNELTGTMAVPVAQSVAYGVPVDNTLGSAEFDLGRVATIIGLQVAAGKSV